MEANQAGEIPEIKQVSLILKPHPTPRCAVGTVHGPRRGGMLLAHGWEVRAWAVFAAPHPPRRAGMACALHIEDLIAF